jgi:hypothetical protein
VVAHIRQKEVISVSVEMVEYTVGNALPKSKAISNILSIKSNRCNSYSGIKSNEFNKIHLLCKFDSIHYGRIHKLEVSI